MRKIIALLIAAHAIADFFLQPAELAKRKDKTSYMFLHSAINAAVVYIALQAWSCWQVPLYVFLFHMLIDSMKQRHNDTTLAFIVDQSAHAISLVVLAWILMHFSLLSGYEGLGYEFIVLLGGFIATVQGAGFLIDRFAKRLTKDNALETKGLIKGGEMIGRLERAMIFLLIFIGQPAGIGFLVAAKSILRLEEAKDRKLAEYVLIGTLLSFLIGIALATATQWALEL